MKKINNFCLVFLILYIPTCILFYNALPVIVDEIMSAIIILFALLNFNIKRDNTKIKNELKAYVGIMLFYIIYSLLLKINTVPAIFYDLQQQVKPYLVFYSTYMLAPMFSQSQYRLISKLTVFFILAFIGVHLAGIRFDYVGMATPLIGQASLLCGLLYYLGFDISQKRHSRIALLILSIGLISGKSKFFGEYVVFIAVVFFLHKKLELNSLKTNLYIVLLAIVVLFFTWTKFDSYYVQGFQTEDISEMEARPASYRTATAIIFKDYIPFGSGLASFATAAAAKYYSPLYFKYNMSEIWGMSPAFPHFIADAFFPTLAEYGLVGVFFFIVFWIRRYKEIYAISEIKYYKVAFLCMLALFLEGVADTSYLSGKGLGYFMLIAICIRRNYYFKEEMKRRKMIAQYEQANNNNTEDSLSKE